MSVSSVFFLILISSDLYLENYKSKDRKKLLACTFAHSLALTNMHAQLRTGSHAHMDRYARVNGLAHVSKHWRRARIFSAFTLKVLFVMSCLVLGARKI